MSFASVPDATTIIGSPFTYSAPKYIILTDTSLTCTVRNWSIETNYSNYLGNSYYGAYHQYIQALGK